MHAISNDMIDWNHSRSVLSLSFYDGAGWAMVGRVFSL